jgi:hypothetical protein
MDAEMLADNETSGDQSMYKVVSGGPQRKSRP